MHGWITRPPLPKLPNLDRPCCSRWASDCAFWGGTEVAERRHHHPAVRLTGREAACYADSLKTGPFSSAVFFMDIILHQLGELLLTSLPTLLLLILLTFYLKYIFFRPLQRVLRERYEATEGSRKLGKDSLERAAAKTAEYETMLRNARAQIYQEQGQALKQMRERADEQIAQARGRAETAVRDAKQQLAADVEAAKASLGKESDSLANEIAESFLRRRAA
jgi:F-type H+-transporting ATPase subunit b